MGHLISWLQVRWLRKYMPKSGCPDKIGVVEHPDHITTLLSPCIQLNLQQHHITGLLDGVHIARWAPNTWYHTHTDDGATHQNYFVCMYMYILDKMQGFVSYTYVVSHSEQHSTTTGYLLSLAVLLGTLPHLAEQNSWQPKIRTPKTMKEGKRRKSGASNQYPKTVSIADHLKQFPGEVHHEKLFCVVCWEALSIEKSIVKNYIYSGNRHKDAMNRLAENKHRVWYCW